MKKRLLFVMESMSSGGGERSLLSLLQLLQYKDYDVDLLLFSRDGIFLEMLPQDVNIIDFGESYSQFSLSLFRSVASLVRAKKFSLAFKRILYSLTVNSKKGSSLGRDQRAWKYMKPAFADRFFEYDAAIGYLEGKPNYFVADAVTAKTKIGYIHSNYNELGLDKRLDLKLCKRLDYLVGVSEKCADVLRKNFPELADKIRSVENITMPAALQKLADAPARELENVKEKIILTVARSSAPKGYDMAVEAAEILAKKNVSFKWFAIGKGEMHSQIEAMIKEKKLEDKFILLGERANPYPYIAACDIYVQPSYYEGKSVAIDEARCFAKPIVSTKFTTVFDQLRDGETALLAEINSQSLAEKIEALINSQALCEKFSENLRREKIGNEEEINKFYEMIEG